MSQLTLKNLIKRKWFSVIIISYLFFLVVKSGGDNFICVKVTLLSLAVLLTHYPWLSFSLLIISVLMNLLKGYYLLTIFILFFLIMFRVALYKKVKGIRWLILIYWSALLLMWTGTIVIFYWEETFFKFLPYNQIGPEPFSLSMSFAQSEASSFKLAPEVWARPSWIYSVGVLSIVEGFAQTPFENMTHLLEVKGLTTGFPSRASLAQIEIDSLISKLESTGLFPFKPSVIENFRDLLKDWHCEPLWFLSNFFEAHLWKLALVENKFQSSGLYQKKLFGLHLYNDWLVLTTYDECTRIGINSITPMGPFNTSQLTDIKVFESNIELMFGERQIEIALSNLRETKALGLQELWDNSPPEPITFDNPDFVHEDLNLHQGPRPNSWLIERWTPLQGSNPSIDSFSQFLGKKVENVIIPHHHPGEGVLNITLADESLLSFPVEVKVGITPSSWSPRLELTPDRINFVSPQFFMFLTPPSGFFMPTNQNILDIPLNWVWGPPLFYKGVITGNPLDFTDDYDHSGALNLTKKLTESNIFHDMSVYQTKGQGQGSQGILKNFETFLKNFNKEELGQCDQLPPVIKLPREELFSRGYIQPSVAVRLWLYGGRIHSPNTSYELTRKVLYLPKKLFLVRSLRQQILKLEEPCQVSP